MPRRQGVGSSITTRQSSTRTAQGRRQVAPPLQPIHDARKRIHHKDQIAHEEEDGEPLCVRADHVIKQYPHPG